jgi:hypothetical protein
LPEFNALSVCIAHLLSGPAVVCPETAMDQGEKVIDRPQFCALMNRLFFNAEAGAFPRLWNSLDSVAQQSHTD